MLLFFKTGKRNFRVRIIISGELKKTGFTRFFVSTISKYSEEQQKVKLTMIGMESCEIKFLCCCFSLIYVLCEINFYEASP